MVFLESHLEAAERFYGGKLPVECEGAHDLYREAFDIALLLKEKTEKSLDTAQEWEELEGIKSEVSRAMTREGYRNWVERGPTRSSRVNQLVFLCSSPDLDQNGGALAELASEVLQVCRKLLTQEPNSAWEPALRQLEEAVRDFDEDQPVKSGRALGRWLEAQLPSLSKSLDLSRLDLPARASSNWYESFCHLAEALMLGEVEPAALLSERDLARGRLQALAGTTFSLGSAGDTVAEIVLDLDETLRELDRVVDDDEELTAWLDELGGLWDELEATLRQTSVESCSVCSHPLEPGQTRCPNCQNTVLALDGAAMASAPGGAQSGSALLDELSLLRERYREGKVQRDAWQAKLERTARKVKSVIRSSTGVKGPEAKNQAEAHLGRIHQSLLALIESAQNCASDDDPWTAFEESCRGLIGQLTLNAEPSLGT